jgi:hypothetical protein
MTKRAGKLQLHRESLRRLSAAPGRGLLAMTAGADTVGPCRSISYCEFCVTYDAVCVEETAYCTA